MICTLVGLFISSLYLFNEYNFQFRGKKYPPIANSQPVVTCGFYLFNILTIWKILKHANSIVNGLPCTCLLDFPKLS